MPLTSFLSPSNDGKRYELFSPSAMPASSAFLWNKKMMIQLNCRGYAVSQYMQPEPAKYAYAPNIEAKSFMQPEQPYFAHHPGRFFYIKDEHTKEIFSVPHEPVRATPDQFCFSAGSSDVRWTIKALELEVEMSVSLPLEDVAELWSFKLTNIGSKKRKISIYPYFPIGFMSWMNQSGEYRKDLGGILAKCVTPYQKVDDYIKIKHLKDITCFLHEKPPHSWEVQQAVFEGEGGLHNPTGVQNESLSNSDSRYETPAGIFQFKTELSSGESYSNRFLFGPAFDDNEVKQLREKYLSTAKCFDSAHQEYADYIDSGLGKLTIKTPDAELDNFVNQWLPRQVFYHGDVNRLTTDPQTRNFLQDTMGMSYIKPSVAREAFKLALSQQESDGAMPDGILLMEGAELKYINQVPHTDHCVWLPICLQAYLDETNDYALLDEILPYANGEKSASVLDHISHAMQWLMGNRDERGLAYIAQGDWCDPMNMVGHKGKGVSGWLTLAIAYALNTWADITEASDNAPNELKTLLRQQAIELSNAANEHFWDGRWYGRGITDDNVLFGVSKDSEGKIFLNPQGWALLSNTANESQKTSLIQAVEEHLETPYGVMMLAPSFTAMRDDVGRVTQKHPGSAENGSVYNHAAAFYVYGLYQHKESDRAYKILRQMIPGGDKSDYLQRGQLPVYIPNYYRGAFYQHPRTAGRSSQLFNTGTVHWFYRCLIDGLFGLRGDKYGLRVEPQLPQDWNEVSIKRAFRGASINLRIRRAEVRTAQLSINGTPQEKAHISRIEAGKNYDCELLIP
ncbi:MAG: cellobionic acid phosphorylase [Flavobacteriales bacterium]|jgi:cellobionic acid phosphorylase